ncbi:hypothetical protein [Litoribaculum gwangyangense]|uniref:Uncharacterized protein n=1 Tax=Litoribaculum gwangyangense TaxID=1130722 RepID=A0ABP9BWI2_9FLAO
MKNVFTILGLLIATVSFGQSAKSTEDMSVSDIKINSLKISVEVDSAEDLESSFLVEDIEKLLDNMNEDEPVEFEIKCNGAQMSNGVKSSLSYKFKGNSKDKKNFLQRVIKIKKSAINYYKNKKQ